MKCSNAFDLLLQMMPSSHHFVTPSSPRHWAFLEEVDAPQWADLVKEAALMGTLGDDPWFHRSHMHHETSLARSENLAKVSDINGYSTEIPIREPQPTTRRGAEKGGGGKGSVSNLIKPVWKGNVVKACLGAGLHRVSSGGSNSRGSRLPSRPRLSASLTMSKAVKRVNIIQCPGRVLQQQQKKAGSDRQAQGVPPSTVETAKKSSEGKPNGRNVPPREPVRNNAREAAARKVTGRRGGGGGGTSGGSTGSRSVGGGSDDTSVKGVESPVPSFRLLAPLGQGPGDISQTDLVPVKSSPSDMYISSEVSPRHSISSQESLARTLSSSAAETARRKILAERRRSSKGTSNESMEIPPGSTLRGNITEVRVSESHLEIMPFNGDDDVVDTSCSTNGGLDWSNQQETNPIVVKASPETLMRGKVTQKVGSSSVKKKSSSRDNSKQNSAAASPAEKGNGAQATHPILEKLRKSWGSALRVKQRHDAEAALSDSRSDTSAENSGEVKVGSNGNVRKKLDEAQVQSEGTRRAPPQAGASTTSLSPSEGEAMIRSIITRERRAAITQQHQQLLQQQPPQELQVITDAGVLNSPSRSGIRNHESENVRGVKPNGTTTESKPYPKYNGTATDSTVYPKSNGTTTESKANPNAAKVGLAKIQVNYQRSKSELHTKFKKQYAYADTGLSKSLSIQRGNKENMEVKVPSPPTGFAWKRKPAVPTRRQLSPGNLVNGVRSAPKAAARTSTAPAQARLTFPTTTPTSPPAKNSVTGSKGSPPFTSTKKAVSLDAADASTIKSETLDRKANNLAVLRRSSTSSALKLTKQKSGKTSPRTNNDATANAAGAKASKNGVRGADEAVVTSPRDRKSKAAPKYVPRLHSVRAIKEWESKSGKLYYDLPPIERHKVNGEISAAVAAAKKVDIKRRSA